MAESDVLEGLKDGVRRFQRDIYPEQAAVYRHAAAVPQSPDTLFVTCADSRVDPETLTSAQPGEMFVTRNIGNMVPAYGDMLGGVSAVLEYAVQALKVRHIVVCGHSDCGAMKALLDPASVKDMPVVRQWLRNAHTALSVAEAVQVPGEDSENLLRSLTEQNVLLQMQHVRTHPSVAGAVARGTLTISGWMYDIAHGEVRICEEGSRTFELVR